MLKKISVELIIITTPSTTGSSTTHLDHQEQPPMVLQRPQQWIVNCHIWIIRNNRQWYFNALNNGSSTTTSGSSGTTANGTNAINNRIVNHHMVIEQPQPRYCNTTNNRIVNQHPDHQEQPQPMVLQPVYSTSAEYQL